MEVKTHCCKAELIQNLKDAGCTDEVIREFLQKIEEGTLPEIEQMLRKHRCMLLDAVHAGQKKIDCLDYLVHMLKKANADCK